MMDIKVPGFIGASDITNQLGGLLFQADFHLDVEVCWPLSKNQGWFPEDIESPFYQMNYQLQKMADNHRINLNHSFNHDREHIRSWGFKYTRQGKMNPIHAWEMNQTLSEIPNKIVYWNINDNEYKGKDWKYSLTNEEWALIRDWLSDDYEFIQLTYRTPIETVFNEIETASIVICHHGMWYQIAKNLFKPTIVLVGTKAKEREMPWYREIGIHVINNPTINDFDYVSLNHHIKIAKHKAEVSKEKYYELRKSRN